MKKIVFTLAFICSIGSMSIMAQNAKSINAAAQKRVEAVEKMGCGDKVGACDKMTKELGLNEKQAKEFKAVWEENSACKKEMGEKPSVAEMEKKHAEADAKIKKILTEEQYTKYKKLEGEKKESFKQEAESKMGKAVKEAKTMEKKVETKVEKAIEKK